MRTLTLLRHAKSSWDDSIAHDFDRPLNGRGRRAAARVGQWFAAEGLAFDHVVASPALRVRQTLDGVADGYGAPLPPMFDARVYMATYPTLFEIVQGLPANATTALLVGHNPGLEELLLAATPDDGAPLRVAAYEKYPTATVAELVFIADDWRDCGPEGATLTRFCRPRDLDPELGPDED